MKRALGILLVGWYLMTPAPGADGKPDLAQPLAEWGIEWSYDTAKECGDALIDKGSIKLRQSGEIQEWETTSRRVGVCLASDDPRLRPAPWFCLFGHCW